MEKYYYHISKDVDDGDGGIQTVLSATPIEFWAKYKCLPDGHSNLGYPEMEHELDMMNWCESYDANFEAMIMDVSICIKAVEDNPEFILNEEFSKFANITEA